MSASTAAAAAEKECVARVMLRISRRKFNQARHLEANSASSLSNIGCFPTTTTSTTPHKEGGLDNEKKASVLSITLPALGKWKMTDDQIRSKKKEGASTVSLDLLLEHSTRRQNFTQAAANSWGNFVTGRNLPNNRDNKSGGVNPILGSHKFRALFRPLLLHPQNAMPVVEKALTHASYLTELEDLTLSHALPWERNYGLELGLFSGGADAMKRSQGIFETAAKGGDKKKETLVNEVDFLSLKSLAHVGSTTCHLSLHSSLGWQVFTGAAPSIAIARDLVDAPQRVASQEQEDKEGEDNDDDGAAATSSLSSSTEQPPLFLRLDKNDIPGCLSAEKEAASEAMTEALAAMTDRCGLSTTLLTGGAIRTQLTSLGLYDENNIRDSSSDNNILSHQSASMKTLSEKEKIALARMKALVGTAVLGAAQSLAGYEAAFLLFNAHVLPELEKSLLTREVQHLSNEERMLEKPGVLQI